MNFGFFYMQESMTLPEGHLPLTVYLLISKFYGEVQEMMVTKWLLLRLFILTYLDATKEGHRLALNDSDLNHPELYDYVIDVAKQFDPRRDPAKFADQTHLNSVGNEEFAGVIANTLNYQPYDFHQLEVLLRLQINITRRLKAQLRLWTV